MMAPRMQPMGGVEPLSSTFSFPVLRQQNSGTGAARRNGVATRYRRVLLLMNDDTIAIPTCWSNI